MIKGLSDNQKSINNQKREKIRNIEQQTFTRVYKIRVFL